MAKKKQRKVEKLTVSWKQKLKKQKKIEKILKKKIILAKAQMAVL